MAESWILRFISLIVVMLVVGLSSFRISLSHRKRKGAADSEAGPKAAQQAKKHSLIAAFLYMVAMVSVAGLFL